MSNEDGEISERHSDALSHPQLGGGRLGTYTLLGAACGIFPLPWVPDATVRRVRGALVHDLTSRHGFSVTPEARALLAEPNGAEGPSGFVAQGIRFAVTKVLGRLGPLALIAPVRSALSTYALGHLLQRYLETSRNTRSVRIDVEEARRVRRSIDQALIYALTTEPRPSREDALRAPEDLRNRGQQFIDGVLVSIASVPGWLERRIDAAFDEVLANAGS